MTVISRNMLESQIILPSSVKGCLRSTVIISTCNGLQKEMGAEQYQFWSLWSKSCLGGSQTFHWLDAEWYKVRYPCRYLSCTMMNLGQNVFFTKQELIKQHACPLFIKVVCLKGKQDNGVYMDTQTLNHVRNAVRSLLVSVQLYFGLLGIWILEGKKCLFFIPNSKG